MQIASLGCNLCSWPIAYKAEVSTTPSLGLINLLEQISELRKIVYSLDRLFITKDMKRQTQLPDEEMHRARPQTKEPEACPLELGVPHGGPWKCSGSPTWKLSEFSFFWIFFFFGGSFIGMIDWIYNYWWLAQPMGLPLPGGLEVGLKVPTL